MGVKQLVFVLKLVKINCALMPIDNSKANISIVVNEPYLLKPIGSTDINRLLLYFLFLSFIRACIK
jgi:hypothetical protein